MNRIFVAERNGKPIERDIGGILIQVEAVLTPKQANARIQVTPIPRLKTEKMVPYVSVETLEAFVSQHGADPELEALIAKAREGCPV